MDPPSARRRADAERSEGEVERVRVYRLLGQTYGRTGESINGPSVARQRRIVRIVVVPPPLSRQPLSLSHPQSAAAGLSRR